MKSFPQKLKNVNPIEGISSARAGFLVSTLIGAVAGGATLIIAPLDFDPHHDGILLAPAIAIAEGRELFSDVFSQYGPIPTVVTSWFLYLWPAGSGLGLRVLGSTLIAVSVFLLSDLGRISPAAWRLAHWQTVLSAIAWLALWDGFLATPLLTWSSLFSSTSLIIALYLIARGSTGIERRADSAKLYLYGAGLIVGAQFFVRQNVGIATLAGVAIGLSALYLFSRELSPTIAPFSVGILTGTFAILIWLLLTAQFQPWWEQNVLWPIEWAADRNNLIEKVARKFVPWTAGPALIGVALSLFFPRGSRPARWVLVASIAVGSLYGGYSGKGFGSLDYLPEARKYAWAEAIWNTGHATLATVFFASSAVVVVMSVEMLIIFIRTRRLNFGTFFIVVFAIGMLAQSVPVMESRHFWWAMAFPILAMVIWYFSPPKLQPDLHHKRFAWITTAALFLAPMLISGGNLILVERIQYPVDSIARGMFGRPGEVRDFKEKSEMLGNLTAELPKFFLVKDGVWSVAQETYESADQFLVNWGNPSEVELRVIFPSTVVTDDDKTFDLVASLASEKGFQICSQATAGNLVSTTFEPDCTLPSS